MRFRHFIATGVLFGLSVMAALFIGEQVVRYLAPQKLYRFPQGLFENHPSLQYRLAPNFSGISKTIEFKTRIRTNALGLRAEREYGRKGPNTFRILCLGDSFTMGVGVEQHETYGHVLEQRLTARRGPVAQSYEVINAGVPGYNTQQAVTYLRELGFALGPDLVVLGFYVGNDIAENYRMPSITVRDGYLQTTVPESGILPGRLRRYIARVSHLYHLLWPYQRQLFDQSYRVKQERAQQRRLAIYAAESDDRDTEALWQVTRQQVEALAEITRSRGVPLAVVIIPELVQVDARKWQATVQPMASNGLTYRADWPNQRLLELCRELEVPVLDLLPVFAQAAPGEPLYIELDSHWTRRGNAAAAAAIEAFLRQRQLIPVSG